MVDEIFPASCKLFGAGQSSEFTLHVLFLTMIYATAYLSHQRGTLFRAQAVRINQEIFVPLVNLD